MKKRIFCLILVISMLLLSTTAFAAEAIPETGKYTLSEPFEYKIVPAMEEWAEYNTLDKKIDVCHVPQRLMESMTTEALVITVLNYPLLSCMFAFNTFDAGVRSVASYFGGIDELFSREDAADELCAYISSVEDELDVKCICAKGLLRYIAGDETEAGLFWQPSLPSKNSP